MKVGITSGAVRSPRPGPDFLISILRLEISQVRGLLSLLDGHEQALGAQEIIFIADRDVVVALDAVVFRPENLLLTTIAVQDFPRTCQSFIDRRDFVVK